MTQHRIEFVTRDRTGITTVVTETGVIDAATVIRNIQSGHSGYYVAPTDWRRAPVRTLSVLGDAFLYANWEGSKRNNLHDLAHTAPIRTVLPGRVGRSRLRAVLAALFGL